MSLLAKAAAEAAARIAAQEEEARKAKEAADAAAAEAERRRKEEVADAARKAKETEQLKSVNGIITGLLNLAKLKENKEEEKKKEEEEKKEEAEQNLTPIQRVNSRLLSSQDHYKTISPATTVNGKTRQWISITDPEIKKEILKQFGIYTN